MQESTWLADAGRNDLPRVVVGAPTLPRAMADALRTVGLRLAPDGGLVVGMADVATVLWSRFHRFDAADPRWPDRDRFVCRRATARCCCMRCCT